MNAKSKPRVLFIMFQLKSQTNGGVNSLIEIIKGINNFHPIVLTQYRSNATDLLSNLGIEVIFFDDSIIGSGIANKIRFSNWLSTLITSKQIDLVHINDIAAYLHSFLATLLKRIPFVLNIRGCKPNGEAYGWHWASVNFASRIICLSEEMSSSLRRGIPKLPFMNSTTKLTHVYSIVDHSIFRPVSKLEKQKIRSQLGIAKNVKVISYVARFHTIKQQLKFIRQTLPKLPNNYLVLFVGDYNREDSDYNKACYEALLSLKNQDSYKLIGYSSKIQKFYQGADITIVPTQREGMARCMVESLSCGTPVVSFNVCSATEILRSNLPCGLVCAQGDYDQLTASITQLLENNEILNTYRQNGVSISMEKFKKEPAILAYEKIYRDLLNE